MALKFGAAKKLWELGLVGRLSVATRDIVVTETDTAHKSESEGVAFGCLLRRRPHSPTSSMRHGVVTPQLAPSLSFLRTSTVNCYIYLINCLMPQGNYYRDHTRQEDGWAVLASPPDLPPPYT
ncbi:hypothetical protein C8J57DRAFT_1220710 [Mycena rebaudengoi]|nr:hypothetical protein C8J57DRAFT_1220710 [Mycena rebaudengoi]